ncbi:MAG: DUF2867 domain-containing protein [Polyangiaceae bacterium]
MNSARSLSEPHFASMAFDDISAPDYADVILEPIPRELVDDDSDSRTWARRVFSIRSAPAWVVALMGLRQLLVGLAGIPRGTPDQFRVKAIRGDEALLSVDDPHLSFRAAVGVDHQRRLLRVTTVVRLNGWRGRIYFAPVSILHPVILRAMMRRALRNAASRRKPQLD